MALLLTDAAGFEELAEGCATTLLGHLILVAEFPMFLLKFAEKRATDPGSYALVSTAALKISPPLALSPTLERVNEIRCPAGLAPQYRTPLDAFRCDLQIPPGFIS